MIKFFLALTTFLLFLFCFDANAQVDSSKNYAKVYVIRPKEQLGAWVNWRIVLDSAVVCKISSGRYVVFTIPEGSHTFNLTSWDRPKPVKKLDYELKLENGKSYYLKIAYKIKGLKIFSLYDEIAENSAKFYLDNYKEDKNCDK